MEEYLCISREKYNFWLLSPKSMKCGGSVCLGTSKWLEILRFGRNLTEILVRGYEETCKSTDIRQSLSNHTRLTYNINQTSLCLGNCYQLSLAQLNDGLQYPQC